MSTHPRGKTADDRLIDQIIRDVCYLDEHRPSTPVLMLLAEHVRSYRNLAAWTDELKREEHRPARRDR